MEEVIVGVVGKMCIRDRYNTVAGSLPGQNWDGAGSEGTAQAKQLRAILKKYPQVLMLSLIHI